MLKKLPYFASVKTKDMATDNLNDRIRLMAGSFLPPAGKGRIRMYNILTVLLLLMSSLPLAIVLMQ